jgi:UDP-glucuronate 4-epimerase
MSTFITGVCGFVGLALAEHLLARGGTVIGFDLSEPPVEALRAFARLPGRFVHRQGDVRDPGAVRAAMAAQPARRLVTLAAVTAAARRERDAPRDIFDVNVGGTLAALEAAIACGVERVVHVSSGSVYGASGNGASCLREDETPLRPEALYGISKLAAESAALRFAALHRLDVVAGRLGTCFGPWEADTGVRDTLSAPLQVLRLAESGTPVVLPRDSRRDWLYVRDGAAGLAALLDAPRLPRPIYNVAAGFMGSISDWCRALEARFPGGLAWRIAGDDSDRAAANVDYYADYDRAPMAIDRLCSDTGFEPRFDLTAAADDFVAWRLGNGPVNRRRVSL